MQLFRHSMAGDAFNDQKYHLAAIQRRERQQVEDTKVDGNQRQQFQQVLPAVAGGLPDGRHDTHRAGEVVDALPPAH